MKKKRKVDSFFYKLKKFWKEGFELGNESQFNIIFLGLTLLTLALVQIISTYYSKSNFAASNLILSFNIATLILILLVVSLILFNLECHILLKLAIYLVIFFIEAAIIVNMLLAAPKAYLEYEYECPNILENNSKIILQYKNLGNIFSSYIFFVESENEKVFFVNNKKEFSKPAKYFIDLNNQWNNKSINIIFKEKLNGSIKIKNSFGCKNLNCEIIKMEGTDNKCEYFCEKGVCQRLK